MQRFDTRRMVTVAVLIAIEIVLSRFLSISTPIVKIGFAFFPISVIAMLYGPLYAGFGAAGADFLGAVLFPAGAFFPGFTLTAFLTGAVYGIFLYRKPKTLPRVAIAVTIITLVLHLGLNTVWLWMITNKGIFAILPTRIAQAAIMLPIQTAGVYFAGKFLPIGQQTRETRW